MIIHEPITRLYLKEVAAERFGDMVKAVVDCRQNSMAIGGELHADEEALLTAQGSKRESTWGINIYPAKSEEEWIEFDSMVNIKPAHGNRSRGVENTQIQERIKEIVKKLVPK